MCERYPHRVGTTRSPDGRTTRSCGFTMRRGSGRSSPRQDFLAVALPPLRPAALCWAVVPPWFDLPEPLCDFSPPCFDAFGEFAIFAARCLDMPLSLSASYWSLFLTLADLEGMAVLLWLVDQ